MFILSDVACIISNLRELKIPFSVKWRQRQKKRDRQRHWGWKQNCVLTWRRSGWTMPVLWASAMGSNPRAFPIGPSARRPVSRLGPGGETATRGRTQSVPFSATSCCINAPALAFPWAFTLPGRLCSLTGMLGNFSTRQTLTGLFGNAAITMRDSLRPQTLFDAVNVLMSVSTPLRTKRRRR